MRCPISSSIFLAITLLAPTHVFGCLQLSCRLQNACADPNDLDALQIEACDLLKNVTVTDPATGQPRTGPEKPIKLVEVDGCGYNDERPLEILQAPNSELAQQLCAGKGNGALGVFVDAEFMVWRAADIGTTVKMLPDLNWQLVNGGTIGGCRVVKHVDCKY